MAGFRPNRKWTASERKGYVTPAQQKYLDNQAKHFERLKNGDKEQQKGTDNG
jgi:hypothetical protein